MARALKAVADIPEPPPALMRTGVLGAAETGNRRDLLVALRDLIASELDGSEVAARDLASLSLRLLAIAREIDEIDAHDEGDDVGNAADTPDEPWAG